MPTLIIIAGPNGAGKTTFAREYLSGDERRFEFVNAAEIARGLGTPSDFLAARITLMRIDELVNANADFVIEERLDKLKPIHFCPIVPGKAAPYPSCVNKKQEARQRPVEQINQA